MGNQNNIKKAELILKTNYHWGVFILPISLSISGIVYAFKDNFKLGILFFLIGLTIGIAAYILNYKDKSFVLTSNKIYFMDKKQKKITINLAHGEFIGYSYTDTIFDRLFNTSNITFHINHNNKKTVLNYFFVKNGKLFILLSFYQSEKYLAKLDPNYQKKLKKPKKDTLFGNKENKLNIDRI